MKQLPERELALLSPGSQKHLGQRGGNCETRAFLGPGPQLTGPLWAPRTTNPIFYVPSLGLLRPRAHLDGAGRGQLAGTGHGERKVSLLTFHLSLRTVQGLPPSAPEGGRP